MKRSFLSLTPQEALHTAVFIEERNSELYHRFAEMFVEFRDLESLEIAGVFWDMAAEERRHSTLLQHKYTEQYGQRACAITEDDLQELIELPRLDNTDVFGTGSTTDLSPRERALQVALNAEQQARKFYASLAENTSDVSLRRIYKELADFEAGHVEYLERKLTEKPTK